MKPDLPYLRPGPGDTPRWNRLSDYFLCRHGERVQKIPLDAGFSCPNRDGALSSAGCVFCNPQGSGTGLGGQGLDFAAQWRTRHPHFLAKGIRLFVAYLQSFSNTYGPIEKLAATLAGLRDLPGLVGIAVGTRPDCVDAAKLALIAAECEAQGWRERWLELGVQSSNAATLARINRGHDPARAEEAIALAAGAGLDVCIHLMAGLPGEGAAEFLESVRWASRQPVKGVKFHCLYVCRGASLAEDFARGGYVPLMQEEYVGLMAEALPLLRPDIVVQRIAGDPAPGELLAPEWAARSRETANKILAELVRRDAWQGKALSGGRTPEKQDCIPRSPFI